MSFPTLKPQEIPFDDPESCNMFRPGPEKPFVATPAAIEMYTNAVIAECWRILLAKAEKHGGLDFLQVFEPDQCDQENLWFVEDAAITALLQSEY